MSKRAEQAALKAYPVHSVLIKPARGGGYYADVHLREGFIQGFEQAEKDLALTWEDVAKIITIYEAGIDNGDYRRYNDAELMKEYSQDILRRFNQWKEDEK